MGVAPTSVRIRALPLLFHKKMVQNNFNFVYVEQMTRIIILKSGRVIVYLQRETNCLLCENEVEWSVSRIKKQTELRDLIKSIEKKRLELEKEENIALRI